MKLRFPFFAFISFVAGVLFYSCGNNSGKISEMKNATAEDSIMYYYGQINANNFWLDAQSDTILKTEEGRKQFIEGFKAGLRSGGEGHAYDRGLQMGARLALKVHNYEQAYNLSLPMDVLVTSFMEGLNSDSVDVSDAQKNFYKIKDRFEVDKGERESGIAKKALANSAKEAGLTIISDTLYARDVTAAKGGAIFKDGDKVEIELTANTVDGHIIGKQFPPKIKIGEGRVPPVVCLALKTMADGQTRLFMTTPKALFGKQFERYFISAQDPIFFTIKASRLPDGADMDNTPVPVQLAK